MYTNVLCRWCIEIEECVFGFVNVAIHDHVL